jgi:hypothetical protein
LVDYRAAPVIITCLYQKETLNETIPVFDIDFSHRLFPGGINPRFVLRQFA